MNSPEEINRGPEIPKEYREAVRIVYDACQQLGTISPDESFDEMLALAWKAEQMTPLWKKQGYQPEGPVSFEDGTIIKVRDHLGSGEIGSVWTTENDGWVVKFICPENDFLNVCAYTADGWAVDEYNSLKDKQTEPEGRVCYIKPGDLVYDEQGVVVGYTMESMQNGVLLSKYKGEPIDRKTYDDFWDGMLVLCEKGKPNGDLKMDKTLPVFVLKEGDEARLLAFDPLLLSLAQENPEKIAKMEKAIIGSVLRPYFIEKGVVKK